MSHASFDLTPKPSERRFYAIGFSSGYCAKFNIPKLFPAKKFIPVLRLLKILLFPDFAKKPLSREKNNFSQADLGIEHKNRIQLAVIVRNYKPYE